MRRPTKMELQPILDKLAKKVAGWKPRMLSHDGRLCLIKSTMMALPVHTMSVIQLPKWAIKEIERKCRVFLWKGQDEVSGGHCLVAWKNVCMPVENGGLGIKNLEYFGHALRLKWQVTKLQHKNRPWSMVDFQLGGEVEKIFQSMAEFIVGNGQNTKFWTSNWLGGGSIAWRWPILSTYVGRSNLSVAQALTGNRWVRDLRGSLSNEALAQYFELWSELQTIHLSQEEDSIRWKLTPDGQFSSTSAYDLFFKSMELCPVVELIWHAKAPSKIRFFMWLATKGRCLTADNLQKRGWPHSDCCTLCTRESEDCAHLFSKCVYTVRVWSLLRSWINVPFPIPGRSELGLTEWWMQARLRFRHCYRDNFDSVCMLVCWTVWKERNGRVFDQRSRIPEQLAEAIKEEVLLWKEAGYFETNNS